MAKIRTVADVKAHYDPRFDFVAEIIYEQFPVSYVDPRRIWAAIKRVVSRKNKERRELQRLANKIKRAASKKT